MITLALDTTTRGGSVAVVDGDTLLTVVHGDARHSHGERLPLELARACELARVEPRQLELLAVAVGPGAFTGLRIGIAAVQGLAMVTGVPTVGVSALDALARAAVPQLADLDSACERLLVITDAARGEVFAASYSVADRSRRPMPAATPVVTRPETLLDGLAPALASPVAFIGDATVMHRDLLDRWGGARCRVLTSPEALAPWVARIGAGLAREGAAGPPHALQPLYVRRPDAELERERHA